MNLIKSLLTMTSVAAAVVRYDLRPDGLPVVLLGPGQLEAEMALHSHNASVSQPFSAEFVKHALNTGRTKDIVGR